MQSVQVLFWLILSPALPSAWVCLWQPRRNIRLALGVWLYQEPVSGAGTLAWRCRCCSCLSRTLFLSPSIKFPPPPNSSPWQIAERAITRETLAALPPAQLWLRFSLSSGSRLGHYCSTTLEVEKEDKRKDGNELSISDGEKKRKTKQKHSSVVGEKCIFFSIQGCHLLLKDVVFNYWHIEGASPSSTTSSSSWQPSFSLFSSLFL